MITNVPLTLEKRPVTHCLLAHFDTKKGIPISRQFEKGERDWKKLQKRFDTHWQIVEAHNSLEVLTVDFANVMQWMMDRQDSRSRMYSMFLSTPMEKRFYTRPFLLVQIPRGSCTVPEILKLFLPNLHPDDLASGEESFCSAKFFMVSRFSLPTELRDLYMAKVGKSFDDFIRS